MTCYVIKQDRDSFLLSAEKSSAMGSCGVYVKTNGVHMYTGQSGTDVLNRSENKQYYFAPTHTLVFILDANTVQDPEKVRKTLENKFIKCLKDALGSEIVLNKQDKNRNCFSSHPNLDMFFDTVLDPMITAFIKQTLKVVIADNNKEETNRNTTIASVNQENLTQLQTEQTTAASSKRGRKRIIEPKVYAQVIWELEQQNMAISVTNVYTAIKQKGFNCCELTVRQNLKDDGILFGNAYKKQNSATNKNINGQSEQVNSTQNVVAKGRHRVISKDAYTEILNAMKSRGQKLTVSTVFAEIKRLEKYNVTDQTVRNNLKKDGFMVNGVVDVDIPSAVKSANIELTFVDINLDEEMLSSGVKETKKSPVIPFFNVFSFLDE